jgi:hypothetical protein
VIANIDPENSLKLALWINEGLKAYSDSFKAQLCSFRTKFEEGIPNGVFESL